MQIHGATFGIEELLEEAHRLQMNLPALNGVGPASKETFRYWVKQGLIAPRLTRGRGTGYEASLAERIAFIRLLQKEFRLSLQHIRKVLAEVSEETISRTVRGEEPVEIINHLSPDAKERMEYGEQMINLMESSASSASSASIAVAKAIAKYPEERQEIFSDENGVLHVKKREQLGKKDDPVRDDETRAAQEVSSQPPFLDPPRNETEDVFQELLSRQRATERQLQALFQKMQGLETTFRSAPVNADPGSKGSLEAENNDLLRRFIYLLNKKGTETNYLYRADYDFEKMGSGRKYYWGSL